MENIPIKNYLAAISVGVVDGETLLDLNYYEDFNAKLDMNVVMTDAGEYIEIQGTGEEAPFNKKELSNLLELAEKGINEIIEIQKKIFQDKE